MDHLLTLDKNEQFWNVLSNMLEEKRDRGVKFAIDVYLLQFIEYSVVPPRFQFTNNFLSY